MEAVLPYLITKRTQAEAALAIFHEQAKIRFSRLQTEREACYTICRPLADFIKTEKKRGVA